MGRYDRSWQLRWMQVHLSSNLGSNPMAWGLMPGTNTAFEESNAVKILELVKADPVEVDWNVAIFKKINKANAFLCAIPISRLVLAPSLWVDFVDRKASIHGSFLRFFHWRSGFSLPISTSTWHDAMTPAGVRAVQVEDRVQTGGYQPKLVDYHIHLVSGNQMAISIRAYPQMAFNVNCNREKNRENIWSNMRFGRALFHTNPFGLCLRNQITTNISLFFCGDNDASTFLDALFSEKHST